jgi:dihydrofolate reductase
MRNLVLYIATSLDGYIAGPSGEIDWLFDDQDYGYESFLAGIDTVLMGRRTYETALSFGDYPYKGMRGFVFSRTARLPDDHVTFASGDPATLVLELKNAPGKKIWLVGGGEIVSECFRHGLIDEYRIFVHPIVLGAGVPLFKEGLPRRRLKFLRSESFNSGLVELSYSQEV